MDGRRGGFRLLAAVALVWTAAWGWIWFDAGAAAAEYGRLYAEEDRRAAAALKGAGDTAERRSYFNGRLLRAGELRDEQVARRERALGFGLSGLAALLAMLVAVTWLGRRGES